jgi:hypothetical protein
MTILFEVPQTVLKIQANTFLYENLSLGEYFFVPCLANPLTSKSVYLK